MDSNDLKVGLDLPRSDVEERSHNANLRPHLGIGSYASLSFWLTRWPPCAYTAVTVQKQCWACCPPTSGSLCVMSAICFPSSNLLEDPNPFKWPCWSSQSRSCSLADVLWRIHLPYFEGFLPQSPFQSHRQLNAAPPVMPRINSPPRWCWWDST